MPGEAPIRILLVDDEKVIRDGCERALACDAYSIHKVEDGTQAVERMASEDFAIVLLDLMMPGMDGFAVLEWIQQNRPGTLVIVVTGFATVAKAVEAMKQGAFDFVGKPFTPDYIRLVVSRAVEKHNLLAETTLLREEKALDSLTIAREQSRLKTVFACMEEAILVTDPGGVVVLHNPAAIRMLDIQTDPVIGKPLSESVRDAGMVALVNEAVRNACSVTREFPPGSISRLFLRAHCAPVATQTGKMLGSVTVFEDISTHKKIDQHKSEFVAMVAHDLRAPLASIVQMIYAIQKCAGDDEERRTHLLERISVRIKDQLQMIENLLSLSRLETGALVLNLEPVFGDTLLGEVIDVVRPKAEGKQLALIHQPARTDWWMNVDRDQMRVVLTNIVDNAIKYTPEGGQVTITSSVNATLARIQIQDTGIGIPPEDLPHIFDRFFRVRGKATRGITGSGLGLSLVQKVVEAHHGSVEVTSEVNRGTCFTVKLPLTEVNQGPDCRAPAGSG
jgi:PAS domain S-box-containing protein